MKKIVIVFCFICLFVFCRVSVDGSSSLSKVVCNVGCKESLDIEGYQMIKSNVNFDKVGNYFIEYEKDGNYLSREVDVLKEDELLSDGFIYLKLNNSTYLNFEIIKMIKLYDNPLLLVKNDYGYYLYFLKIKYLSKCLVDTSQGSICDVIYDEESRFIYAVGSKISSRGDFDTLVVKIKNNGVILDSKLIGGSKSDEGNFIINYNGFLYVIGNTLSNDGLFLHPLKDSDSYIVKLDHNLSFVEYYDIGRIGNDKVEKIILADNLYFVMSYYSYGYRETSLCEFSFFNEKTLNVDIPTYGYLAVLDLMFFKGKIYLAGYVDETLRVYEIDKNNNIRNVYSVYLEYFEECIIGVLNEKLYLCYHDDKYINFSFFLDESNLCPRYYYDNKVSLYFLDDELYLVDDHYLSRVDIQYLMVVKCGIYLDKLLLNFEECEYDVIGNVDSSVYGEYLVKYLYSGDGFDFIYQKNYEVILNTNIKNNNNYSVGLVLDFNAGGKLNGSVISNGYKILDSGSYVLELYSNNGVLSTIHFNVFDNIKYDDIGECYDVDLIKKDYMEDDESLILVNQNLTKEFIIDTDYNKDIWYLLLPSSTSVILLVLYFVLGKRYL